MKEADEKWTKTLRNLTSEIGFVKDSLACIKIQGVPAKAEEGKVSPQPHVLPI